MASPFAALLCALAATVFWTCVGLPIGKRVVPGALAWPAAPALGWAVHNAVALPIFLWIEFSRVTVCGVALLSLLVAAVALRRPGRTDVAVPQVNVPRWAYAGAALLALGIAIAIVPKPVGDGVALAEPIFDHAKVAMIDEMARLGVPPGNPFFGPADAPARLAYYYLWHFSAAELALAAGVSGWEADIAGTWFAAFAALSLMMGLATWFSARAFAAPLALAFAATASARTVLSTLFGFENVSQFVLPRTGFGGWLFQAAWVPQHVASASCVLLAMLLIARLLQRPSALLVVTLALVTAAGFESSTWIGGVTFALAAPIAGAILLASAKPGQRLPFLLRAAAAAALAAVVAAPFMHDQVVATALRGGGFPIAFSPYEVLGPAVPEMLRRSLDLPAYWLVLLVIECPATFVAGAVALVMLLAFGGLDRERHGAAAALAALAGTGLAVGWLLVSTLADNNDLGWRAILPACMVLIVFAAVGLSGWIAARAWLAAASAAAALVVGASEGGVLIDGNAVGSRSASAAAFAQTPAMWAEVRRYSAADERVANDPLFLEDLAPWPGNLSWALLSDRRSCFAGRELALVFTSLPRAAREAIDAQFIRVFHGEGTPDDVRDLATRYGCRVVVVTAEDAIWSQDPFAASPFYTLVATRAGRWRIYRSNPGAG